MISSLRTKRKKHQTKKHIAANGRLVLLANPGRPFPQRATPCPLRRTPPAGCGRGRRPRGGGSPTRRRTRSRWRTMAPAQAWQIPRLRGLFCFCVVVSFLCCCFRFALLAPFFVFCFSCFFVSQVLVKLLISFCLSLLVFFFGCSRFLFLSGFG